MKGDIDVDFAQSMAGKLEFLEVVWRIVMSISILMFPAAAFFVAYFFFYKYVVQKERCTEKTIGTVVKYTFAAHGADGGIHLPIVRYSVRGREYHVVGPQYRAYRVVTRRSPSLTHRDVSAYEEDGVLHITREANAWIGMYKNPMRSLYPIGSELPVYYCPENPRLAYVLRYCDRKWMFYLMLTVGIAMSVLVAGGLYLIWSFPSLFRR